MTSGAAKVPAYFFGVGMRIAYSFAMNNPKEDEETDMMSAALKSQNLQHETPAGARLSLIKPANGGKALYGEDNLLPWQSWAKATVYEKSPLVLRYAPGPFSLKCLLNDLLADAEQTFSRNGLSFEWRRATIMPDVTMGDEGALRRLIHDVLSVALAHTVIGGVLLTTAFYQDQLEIKVTDSGEGYSHQEQEEVFGPLVRHAAGDKALPESGHDLADALRTALLLGGKVKVDTAEGIGTTVTIQIPMTPVKDIH